MQPEPGGIIPQVGTPPEAHLPLIRHSHIFSNAIREVFNRGDGSITSRQLELLTFVALAHHHVEEIARFLGVTAPAATRAVDTLERRELVIRRPSTTDRRVKVVSCSPKGRRLLARLRSLEEKRMAAASEALSPDEVAQLSSLLERCALALLAGDTTAATYCLHCAGYSEPNCPLRLLYTNCGCRPRGGSDDD